jgi:hypothetical protein
VVRNARVFLTRLERLLEDVYGGGPSSSLRYPTRQGPFPKADHASSIEQDPHGVGVFLVDDKVSAVGLDNEVDR